MNWIELTSDPSTWPPIGEEVYVQLKGLKTKQPQVFRVKIREGEGLGRYLRWSKIEL